MTDHIVAYLLRGLGRDIECSLQSYCMIDGCECNLKRAESDFGGERGRGMIHVCLLHPFPLTILNFA